MLHYKKFIKDKESDWIVFIHGIGGSTSVWFKQVRFFSKHFNLLLIDLHGHGKSDNSITDIYQPDFFKISNDIDCLMESLCIEDAHFIGVSMGSVISQAIEYKFPNRVKSLTLIGSVEHFDRTTQKLIKTLNLLKNFLPYTLVYAICARIILPKKSHKTSRDIFVREAHSLGRKEFMAWYNLNTEINVFFEHIDKKRSEVPRLYVMGDEDHMFTPYIQQKKEIINNRNTLLIVFNKCGHVCNIEKSEDFNEIAFKFIKGVSSSEKQRKESDSHERNKRKQIQIHGCA